MRRRFGKAFHEAFKKPSENSKIFESLLSSCKAAYYFKKNTGTEPFKSDFDRESQVELHFFLPLIVLDGLLFEAFLERGEIVLSEANWIPIEYEYASAKYESERSRTTFLPTIVRYKGFEDYLKLLDEWIADVNESFAEDLISKRRK